MANEQGNSNLTWHHTIVSSREREERMGQRGCVVWFTGLSGSGKSTIAVNMDHKLFERGYQSYILDGDNIRHGLNSDLGFSPEARVENIRRISQVGKLFADAGVICVTAFISPYISDRQKARSIVPAGRFFEVHVNAPVEICEQRDPKGLYKKARAGELKGFTGIDDPYEAPAKAEVTIDATGTSPQEAAAQLIAYLEKQGILA